MTTERGIAKPLVKQQQNHLLRVENRTPPIYIILELTKQRDMTCRDSKSGESDTQPNNYGVKSREGKGERVRR